MTHLEAAKAHTAAIIALLSGSADAAILQIAAQEATSMANKDDKKPVVKPEWRSKRLHLMCDAAEAAQQVFTDPLEFHLAASNAHEELAALTEDVLL